MGPQTPPDPDPAGADHSARRLHVYNAGFLTQPRLRRILTLAGWQVRLGWPRRDTPDDWVGVWGRSRYAARGEAVAARQATGLLRVEDAFLRSVHPGRAGAPPLGLLLDPVGVHFDSATPSTLEQLLATHPLDDTALLNRARAAMARLQARNLSKYNDFDPDLPAPAPGYVLVVDQTAGDASIRHGGASAATFNEMLAFAQIENPGARILIKTHPETRAGYRGGHFATDPGLPQVEIYDAPASPWALLEGATAVYTVSSQLGFEAIMAGHKPRVFGQPFYAGWGLTQDETPVPRRERRLTRAQLFAAAMILAPTWYDPFRDELCDLERGIDILEAQTRAWREDRAGGVGYGMRAWKRGHMQRIFGHSRRLRFSDDPARAARLAAASATPVLAWAGRVIPALEAETAALAVPLVRVEDGFLRSRGLGAQLVAPLSLVRDDLGIYYDPTGPSRLECLITAAPALPAPDEERARRVIARLIRAGLSKYNLSRPLPDLPEGRRILVPGQVEDDASIQLGCTSVRRNLALLRHARAANPDAVIVYKPHPDVEAGLRPGRLSPQDTAGLADVIASEADPIGLIDACDAVWTMTSLMGFEALLRGKPVTCLGAPFYAGWGLTDQAIPLPAACAARRQARPSLTQLAHAVLIDYPRYFDPVTGTACPVEVVVDRLENAPARAHRPAPHHRLLARAQGMLAGYAWLWRR
ncbi:MAG: capsular polysaccharide biosynthesis protein [Celeribacter sp.]|jgi:capsular polysaccharide export protein